MCSTTLLYYLYQTDTKADWLSPVRFVSYVLLYRIIKLVVIDQLVKKLRNLFLHLIVRELTGSNRHVTASAVFQHERANVNTAGSVEDRVTDCAGAALTALAVNYPAGDILLGVKTVNQEAVSGVDRGYAAEASNYYIALNACVLAHHFLEFLSLFIIELDTLLNVGPCEYFISAHVCAALEQLLHELIVTDS